MSKKDRRSHDQKRKAKLAKEARRARQHTSPLAYRGNKYKTREYAPLFFETERGIHEVDVLSERQLTDRDVQKALEELVVMLRQPDPPPPDERDEVRYVKGQETDVLIWNIRRHWKKYEEDEGASWARHEQIGVLRTLLGSIEVWSLPSAQSRGYLQYLTGFLKQAGGSVSAMTPTGELLEEPEEDALLELGRDWCEGDEEVGDEFRKLADERIHHGEAESVVDVAQQLIGEYGAQDKSILAELSALSIHAQRSMQKRLS